MNGDPPYPDFGCPRTAMIISKTFGVDIDKDVVRRVLANHYQPQPGMVPRGSPLSAI